MEHLFTGQLSSWVSSYDWSQTPLGAVENWSSDLKASVQILVTELERAKTSTDSLNSSLYNSQQRYDTLFKSIDQGFCISEMLFDAEGRSVDYRFLEVNSLFEPMTGLIDATGKTALELIPDLETFWIEAYGRVVLTGESVQFEHESKALNRWFEVNAFPIDAPQEFRFGVLFTDISDRHNAEIRLRLIQERLEISLAAGDVGVWDLDLVNKQAWRSIEHDRIFGYEELLSDWSYEIFLSHIIPEDKEQIDREFQAAIANRTSWQTECEIRTVNGELCWIWIKARTEYNQNNEPVRMYGVVRDISDRKRQQLNNNFLVEIQKDLAIIEDADQIMDVVGEKIRKWFNFSILTFVDIDVAADEARTIYASNDSDVPNAVGKHLLSEYYSETHLQHLKAGQAVAISDVRKDSNIKDNGSAYEPWQVLSSVSLPCISDGQLKFLMGGNRRVPSVWRQDELELMSELTLRIYLEIERVRIELQLRESEERLRLAIEGTNMGTWDLDLQTQKLVWSARNFQLLGYEPSATGEATHEMIANCIYPDDREILNQRWQKSLQARTQFHSEHRMIRFDNQQIIWVEDLGSFIYDDHGQAVRATGVVFDISDRKRAETALRQSEERYRHLVELIPQMVWTADDRGAPLDVNQRWLDFTGLATLKEAKSQGLRPFLHPDDIETMSDRWNMAQQEGSPLQAESRIRRHDGTYRWYLHQAIPVKNDRGQVVKWFGTGTDIETQKQLEHQYTTLLQKVQERNQELDQFSYIVSHDLKAPLRAISNLAEWLQEDLQDLIPPENQQQLHLMRSRVLRMEELIDGLLTYARISREDIPLNLVSVAELLEEVIDSLAPPPRFTIEISSPLPTYRTKRILLHQVLSNLIGNAIKHHDRPDGKITITVQDAPDFSEFAIADDGRGIEPLQQTRIFEIFQTLETQNIKQSTGVGLAIVKKIVESEGGKIQLKSEIGQGSTFSFTWLKHSDLE